MSISMRFFVGFFEFPTQSGVFDPKTHPPKGSGPFRSIFLVAIFLPTLKAADFFQPLFCVEKVHPIHPDPLLPQCLRPKRGYRTPVVQSRRVKVAVSIFLRVHVALYQKGGQPRMPG